MANTVLYISYNGIAEPLVHSQVLNYLEGLTGQGYRFVLLTFERESLLQEKRLSLTEKLGQKGIFWRSLPVSRLPGLAATLSDIYSGAKVARELVDEFGIELIHARSFVPAVIACLVKQRTDIPYLNDIRGFWVDEKVYKGSLAQNGLAYRLGKKLESWVYQESNAIVSLTDRGLEEIRAFSCFKGRALPPMATIPTCVDVASFRWRQREFQLPLVFGYVGSLGPGYMPEMLFKYFALARARFPGSRLKLVTRTAPERLWALADTNGVPRTAIDLKAVEPESVPVALDSIDIGLSFISPHFAKLASCPTKVGEYLAAGIPVVSNAGIGDLDRLVGDQQVGCLLSDFSDETIERSLQTIESFSIDSQLGTRCRALAEDFFSLERGIRSYADIYRDVFTVKSA